MTLPMSSLDMLLLASALFSKQFDLDGEANFLSAKFKLIVVANRMD